MDYVFDLNTLETTGIIDMFTIMLQENFQAYATFVAGLYCGTLITRRHIKPEPRSMLNNFILEATRALRAV